VVLAGRITGTNYEDGTHTVFQNVGTQNSDARESPKRKNTTFRTWQKFEIRKCALAMYDTDHSVIMYTTFSKSEI